LRADETLQSRDAVLRTAQVAALDLARSADPQYGTLAARLLLEIARELGAVMNPEDPMSAAPGDPGQLVLP